MKSKFTTTLILIIIVLAVTVFILTAPLRNVEAPIVSNTSKSDTTYDSIAHTFSKDDVETNTTSIHITKPVILGLPNKVIEKAVNDQIETIISNTKKAFLSETSGIETFSNETKHQLTISGSAPFVSTEHVFYIDIEIYTYYSGSAHPLSQRMVLNFVKETGQLIRLEDILKEESMSEALRTVASIVKPKIIEKLDTLIKDNEGEGRGIDSFEESGIASRAENYSVFYIHADRIEWVFGQYQVAPYVFGEIKASVPMDRLNSYMVPRAYLR
jgi:hypothetical protein